MRFVSVLCLFTAFALAASLREIRIEPQVAYLHGVGGAHRLLLSAIYTDGAVRDITAEARVTFDDPAVIETDSPGQIKALREGIAKVRIEFEGQHAEGVAFVQPARTKDID